jgi:hypothetical protein
MFIIYPVQSGQDFFCGGGRMKWSGKACLGGLTLMLLLSGCASAKVPETAAAQPMVSQEVQASGDDGQADVQNRKERQLVLLIQALLQMDRKEGLSISKEQAAGLLPLIRKSQDKGQLTAEEQKQTLNLLSAAQKTFYDDLAIKMKDRMNRGNRRNNEHVSPEQRDKLIEQFKSRQNHPPADPVNHTNRGDDTEPPSGKDFGKSMEQQLIDLLESRANS